MPTLYVENVPKDLYEALRKRARANRKSMAAEVISLLEKNVATAAELKKRHEFYERIVELRGRQNQGLGPFPSAAEMIREDRNR
jgi:plasmid stability protein